MSGDSGARGVELQPQFLAAGVGNLVVVQTRDDWWMGHVIHVEGGARSQAPSLFQVACVDTGAIRTVNGDAVVAILQSTTERAGQGSGPLQPADNHPHQHQGAGQGDQQGEGHGAARRGF